MIDPLYALCGLLVGFLVGITGVGGGSLMTPLLILVFGIHPATAVGTDLLYAAATKTAGTLFHNFARSIDWRIVRRLAYGSLPATVATLLLLSHLNPEGKAASSLVTIVLAGALFVTAAVILFQGAIVAAYRAHVPESGLARASSATVAVGAVLGVLVSISSVGAGAIGLMALVLLYPRMPLVRAVGSDIAHAVPLTLAAGIGHWLIGTVDWHVIGSLLTGSLPGILLGSWAAVRASQRALRLVLAVTLLVVAGKLVSDHIHHFTTITTAFTRRAVQ